MEESPHMTNNQTNRYKTSDMKIHKDSQGCYSVDHKFQGTLIDGHYFSSRTECRRAAAGALKEMKEDEEAKQAGW